MIIPVILSGGAGTRLWPLSREQYPKQLLPLVGESTMLQETVARLGGLPDLARPIVVCNEDHRFMVAEQLRQGGQPASAIILEPVGRNTAPAVAVAAMQAMQDGEDPFLLVLPADHAIQDADALCRTIAAALPFADEALLTFGVVPSGPETGYGYIRAGSELAGPQGAQAIIEPSDSRLEPTSAKAYQVAAFVEKPDLATAEGYLAAGSYFWNSGMFLFRCSTFLDELETLAPDMFDACRQAWTERRSDLDFTRLGTDSFAACPSDSIDYAVMEKTARGVVVPLDAGWSDVGSWAALWQVSPGDAEGNVCVGDVVAVDTHNTYVYSGSRLVASVGLDNAVIVETADAVLVAAKDKVQEVKQVVELLKQSDRKEHLLHRLVNRPWGTYEGLDDGPGFLVKRITVNPGASLSLQRHRHRAEHWVVVRGTARVTLENIILERTANQSVYIPIGDKHRLENAGDGPLEIIEVQTGDYLSEDDIERFSDDYGR